MAKYLIQEETLTAIADKIRVLSGTEDEMTTDEMNSNLDEANNEVNSQADIIAQIQTALEGKAGGGANVETCTVEVTSQSYASSYGVAYSVIEDNEKVNKVSYLTEPLTISGVEKGSIFVICGLSAYTTSGCTQINRIAKGTSVAAFTIDDNATIYTYMCFAYNTRITLANMVTKPVQDITYSDKLLVWDFDNGCYASAYPLWIKQEETALKYYHCIFENGITLDLVGSNGNCHAVYCLDDNRFEYANNCIGKTVMTKHGATKLLSCEPKNEVVKFYNIMTNYHINCYANDILTSTKLNNIYPMKDMKFIKEDRQLLPFEKFDGIPEEFYYGLRLGENNIEDVEQIKNNLALKLSKMKSKSQGGNVKCLF